MRRGPVSGWKSNCAFDPSSLTGITGPTASLSLWFLRDLFVSLLLVRFLLPVLSYSFLPVLLLLFIVAIVDMAEPLVFRPTILLFVAAGAALGQRTTLTGWMTGERLLLVFSGITAAYWLCRNLAPDHARAALNIVKRAALTIAVLLAIRHVAGTPIGDWIAQFERRIFGTYLIHLPLFGVLWTLWGRSVGGPMDPSYAHSFSSSRC